VQKILARTVLVAAMLLAAASCGYEASTSFNADGSVTVGLKFLFPKALMQGSSGATVSGMSPADVAAAQTKLQAAYPGAKVALVTEGDESGALITIPFKTEKDAFAFLTQPSQLKPSTGSSGTSQSINLSNTGGLFKTATHTTSGQSDTYTFTTLPATLTSPSPGQQQILSNEDLASIFTVTFALTVPHVISSAPGALFTQDRKTAIWKMSWLKAQTLTATTGPDATLAGFSSNNVQGPSPVLLVAIAFVAAALGFLAGVFMPWRRLH
jgi:hypothetical protein